MSVVSMSLKKALSFRSVELALRGLQSTEGVHEQIVDQTVTITVPQINERVVDSVVLLIKEEIVEVMQLVLVERSKSRVADQMGDVPVPPVTVEIVAVVQDSGLGR